MNRTLICTIILLLFCAARSQINMGNNINTRSNEIPSKLEHNITRGGIVGALKHPGEFCYNDSECLLGKCSLNGGNPNAVCTRTNSLSNRGICMNTSASGAGQPGQLCNANRQCTSGICTRNNIPGSLNLAVMGYCLNSSEVNKI
jgi:hypothetical protein